MYDIVQEGLVATTKEEAESILYGSKGMLENSQAFYSSIVSRFIKKKDIVFILLFLLLVFLQTFQICQITGQAL